MASFNIETRLAGNERRLSGVESAIRALEKSVSDLDERIKNGLSEEVVRHGEQLNAIQTALRELKVDVRQSKNHAIAGDANDPKLEKRVDLLYTIVIGASGTLILGLVGAITYLLDNSMHLSAL